MPIRLTLTVTGPDDPAAEFRRMLDDAEVEVDCPRCRMATPATVGELRTEAPVICMGCRITLRPTDTGALFDYP